jgi:predicted DNA-binding transcriptional regulator AlpA
MVQNVMRLLRELEAAKLLSVAPGTMRNWRLKRRGPPYYKVGRLIRYSEAEVLWFAERGRIDNSPQQQGYSFNLQGLP